MKCYMLPVMLLAAAVMDAQEHKLEKLWETDSIIAIPVPQGIDGIEPVGNGDYILTAWAGYIFYVNADGRIETLLDTHLEKMNTADIGYDPDKNIIYVPTFNAKRVVAYRLK